MRIDLDKSTHSPQFYREINRLRVFWWSRNIGAITQNSDEECCGSWQRSAKLVLKTGNADGPANSCTPDSLFNVKLQSDRSLFLRNANLQTPAREMYSLSYFFAAAPFKKCGNLPSCHSSCTWARRFGVCNVLFHCFAYALLLAAILFSSIFLRFLVLYSLAAVGQKGIHIF